LCAVHFQIAFIEIFIEIMLQHIKFHVEHSIDLYLLICRSLLPWPTSFYTLSKDMFATADEFVCFFVVENVVIF